MQIFIDSADVRQIKFWLAQGVVDGATTNPSIMFKDGVTDLRVGALRICELLGDRPLSVEVTTNELEVMLLQAREFATWAPNIVVKIPIINETGESCLGVIHALKSEGIPVNATRPQPLKAATNLQGYKTPGGAIHRGFFVFRTATSCVGGPGAASRAAHLASCRQQRFTSSRSPSARGRQRSSLTPLAVARLVNVSRS